MVRHFWLDHRNRPVHCSRRLFRHRRHGYRLQPGGHDQKSYLRSANQRSRASFCVAVLELGRHLGGGYRMYRSTISGSSYSLLASVISGTSYSDQTVQSGTAYYYVVTAVDSAGREIPIQVR